MNPQDHGSTHQAPPYNPSTHQGPPTDVDSEEEARELEEAATPSFPDGTIQRLVVDRFGEPQDHQVDMSLLEQFNDLLDTATTIVTRAGRLQAQGILTEKQVDFIKSQVRTTLIEKLMLDE